MCLQSWPGCRHLFRCIKWLLPWAWHSPPFTRMNNWRQIILLTYCLFSAIYFHRPIQSKGKFSPMLTIVLFIYFMCVGGGAQGPQPMCEVKGQLAGLSPALLPCTFQHLTSCGQAWWPAPLPISAPCFCSCFAYTVTQTNSASAYFSVFGILCSIMCLGLG